MTKSSGFTQGDITKVIKGAQVADLSVKRITIEPDGKIVADFDDLGGGVVENEWDVVLPDGGRKVKGYF